MGWRDIEGREEVRADAKDGHFQGRGESQFDIALFIQTFLIFTITGLITQPMCLDCVYSPIQIHLSKPVLQSTFQITT